MFWKYFILNVIVVICSFAESSDNFEEKPFNELPCLSFGGVCVQSDDCPEGNQMSVRGLCPVQQRSGVECCQSLAKSETKCRSRGGECMSRSTHCADSLTFSRATDCKSDEMCCILVR